MARTQSNRGDDCGLAKCEGGFGSCKMTVPLLAPASRRQREIFGIILTSYSTSYIGALILRDGWDTYRPTDVCKNASDGFWDSRAGGVKRIVTKAVGHRTGSGSNKWDGMQGAETRDEYRPNRDARKAKPYRTQNSDARLKIRDWITVQCSAWKHDNILSVLKEKTKKEDREKMAVFGTLMSAFCLGLPKGS